MNRDDHLNNVAKNVGRLINEIRALNAIGRFDINSVTEDFLVPILRIVFSCPDLRNLNEIQLNFPAVDLGCDTTRISFQVTTDASSSKAEKTLERFHFHGLDKRFKSVVIFALTEKQSSYNAAALNEAISQLSIPFCPKNDIIDFNDLLVRIRRLQTDDLERIDAYLAAGWKERDRLIRFRDQLQKFLEFSTGKIEFEKKSKKYIPSIFVETHATKDEVRLFANPLFFYRKVQDKLSKYKYDRLNLLLRIARERELASDLDGSLLVETPATFAELDIWLDRVASAANLELSKVRPMSWRRDESEKPREPFNTETAEWAIVQYPVESLATGMTSYLQEALDMINLMRKKIFLITGMAGQGKTNFVCDLVENQFRLFGIPSLFIPARELNSYSSGRRLFEYIANNRYAPEVTKIHDLLYLFNQVALDAKKPFLIVMDGINEVQDQLSFKEELSIFCGAVCQYEMVKIVVTCRSEFFDAKYASMLDEPFSTHIHRVGDLRAEMSEPNRARLLKSYFAYFKIKGSLSARAASFLKGDLLLLRIFCERYEDSDVGYLTDIYKGELFEEYLRKKIASFPLHQQVRALPTLYKIVTAMLEARNFDKLSVRSFSPDDQEVVRRFVEDDIILRQEVEEKGLSTLGELAISFTYDELRDFVTAYKLLMDERGGEALSLKAALTAMPGLPVYEGVCRYAYLLARKEKNAAAIAACENGPDFLEHFSLNVHLLPPTLQTPDDVTRVRALLADFSAAERLRRVAVFLVHRRDTSELLNITILRSYLNELEPADHAKFVSTLFAQPDDYEQFAWRRRVHELIADVFSDESRKWYDRYDSEWLAFFLHASSLADWAKRERVSMLFRESMDQPSCCGAMELVRGARAEVVRLLVSDIECGEEDRL